MTEKSFSNDLRFAALKNESTRQRWELFHRAIALAKKSNADALDEEDRLQRTGTEAPEPVRARPEPILSIAR
jgi:hypothetical protein